MVTANSRTIVEEDILLKNVRKETTAKTKVAVTKGTEKHVGFRVNHVSEMIVNIFIKRRSQKTKSKVK